MGRLFRAFFFKIRKEPSFKITLIIGASVALVMSLLYLLVDKTEGSHLLSGPNMLLNSTSPVSNFGIAIPINLVSFTCLEFTQGTIRNKIIAGNSKFKIYVSLFLTGLIYTFALLIVYVGVCTLLGVIFGGFDFKQAVMVGIYGAGYPNPTIIAQVLIVSLCIYVFLTSLAVFVGTTFRTVGPTISVVVVVILLAYFGSVIVMAAFRDNESVLTIFKVIDPMYALIDILPDAGGNLCYESSTFILSIVSNLAYAAIFFVAGSLIFKHRDVK